MSIIEKSGTLTYVDGEDNSIKLYPETKAANVDISILNGSLGVWKDLGDINDAFIPSIAYGKGIFVAVDHDKHFYHSTDCITWTKLDITANGDLADVCFGLGVFVAVCTNGWIYHSVDGMTWTEERIVLDDLGSEKISADSGTLVGTDMDLRCVTCGSLLSNTFVFAGQHLSGYVSLNVTFEKDVNEATVSDHAVSYSSTMTYSDICFGNNKYIAVGFDTNTSGTICTSADGISWISVLAHTSDSVLSVCYGMGRCVAVANDGRAYYSNDSAVTFVETKSLFALGQPAEISYINRTFVIADQTGKTYVSNDGSSWGQLFNEHCGKDTTFNLIDMGDKFMLVNRVGKIQTLEFARDNKDMESVMNGLIGLFGNNIRYVKETVKSDDIEVTIEGYAIGRIVQAFIYIKMLNDVPGGASMGAKFNSLVPISTVLFTVSPGTTMQIAEIILYSNGTITLRNHGTAALGTGWSVVGSAMYILK